MPGFFLLALLACLGVATWAGAFDEALAHYRENRFAEALPLFERAAAGDPDDARVHLWLADTYRRLGCRSEAIAAARRALEIDSCSSFAHVVLAGAYSPGAGMGAAGVVDSVWHHLLAAVQCDSTDGNAWEYVVIESIRRGEPVMSRLSLRMLVRSGHLTPAALAYGRWLLRTLPDDAILLTNGDLDTYSAMAVQEVEGFRRDVVVAERGLIGVPWFLRSLRDRAGVPLPFADAQLDTLSTVVDAEGRTLRVSDRVLRGWLDQQECGELGRPVCLAVTVDESFRAGIEKHLQDAGPFSIWRPAAVSGVPDTAAIRRSLVGIGDNEFGGPWAAPGDRSPVHHVYSKRVVRTVTGTGLTYAEWLIRAGRTDEAEEVLEWAQRFELRTELGPSLTREIANLRAAAAKRPGTIHR